MGKQRDTIKPISFSSKTGRHYIDCKKAEISAILSSEVEKTQEEILAEIKLLLELALEVMPKNNFMWQTHMKKADQFVSMHMRALSSE